MRSYCELPVRGARFGLFGLLGSGNIGHDAPMRSALGLLSVGPVRRVDAATPSRKPGGEVPRAQVLAAGVDDSMLDLKNQPIGVA
jgi:hypothetical protein